MAKTERMVITLLTTVLHTQSRFEIVCDLIEKEQKT